MTVQNNSHQLKIWLVGTLTGLYPFGPAATDLGFDYHSLSINKQENVQKNQRYFQEISKMAERPISVHTFFLKFIYSFFKYFGHVCSWRKLIFKLSKLTSIALSLISASLLRENRLTLIQDGIENQIFLGKKLFLLKDQSNNHF